MDVKEAGPEVFLTIALRNMLLLHALEDVLAHLVAEGIEVIVLKGAALALTVYQNIGLRPMSDVDLLIRPAQASAALHVMSELGYTHEARGTRPGDILAHECEVALTKPDPDAPMIELHWSLIDSPHYQRVIDMDWLWATARPLMVRDTPALMLGPEAQVLHLCAHLALHHPSPAQPHLLWLNDIVEVIRHYQGELDWDELLRRAQMYDLVLPLQRILPGLAAEWDAPIPDATLTALLSLQPTWAEKRVFGYMTDKRRTVGRRFWADVVTTVGWRERLGFAAANLFPAPAYMRERYGIQHPWLTPLYYPYRWWLGLRSLWA